MPLKCAVIALDAQWKLFGCSSNSPVMIHGCILNSPRIPLQFTSIHLYFHNFYPCSGCSLKALWMLIKFSCNAPWMRPQFSKCPLQFTCINSYFQNFNLQVYTYYTLPLKALWMFIQFSYNAPWMRPQFSKDPPVIYTYPMILQVLPTPSLPLLYSPII